MQKMFYYTHIYIYSESDCTAFQDDLNKLSEWAHTWLVEFNVKKCEHLRITNIKCPIIYSYFLGTLLSQRFHTQNTSESPLTRNYHGTNAHKESLAKLTKLISVSS